MKYSRRNLHFTLIELLVVIAIIGILMAILFPALTAARAKAANVLCVSQMRQINLAMVVYISDFDEHLPTSGIASETYFTSRNFVIGGLGLLVSVGNLGLHQALFCPDIRNETVGWGAQPASSESKRRRWMRSLPNSLITEQNTRCDYSLAWGHFYGVSPTIEEATSQGLRYWIADDYTKFDNIGYKKLSHPLYRTMNLAATDGSVATVHDWWAAQPQTGDFGYYYPYNDRSSWGFWRYFGKGFGIER